MPDITVSYKGNTIGTIDATGRHTVDAQGYYMEDNVTIDYVKPGGSTPSLTNLIQNGDFSVQGATTNGWSSLQPSHSSISISGGKLVLTHTVTSNRGYGVSYAVNIQADHVYLVHYKMTKTMVDSDSDAKGIRVLFGGFTGQLSGVMNGLTQDMTFEGWSCAKAESAQTKLSFTFLGSIATAASNDSMFELWFVEMYDITDVIP